ncbi:hypothetical protein AB6A40_008028 [Gnathostoma spinigerum]|uniref:ShKT domain-containing protein n=1 Tax=Gnathostoma spinigerum TaxID=75299 RepID=A0ABD6EVN3_9BILA
MRISLWIHFIPIIFIKKGVLGDNDPLLECTDSDTRCAAWAEQGECHSNAVWMMANCRLSCHSCQGGDAAWRLREFIINKYDNRTEARQRRFVEIESIRIAHVEIDEEKQYVTIEGRMSMSWNDTQIAWNRNEWGLDWLNFYWVNIWTPMIVQTNGVQSSSGLVRSKIVAANYTGQVYMWVDIRFKAPYSFRYEDYPNDYQDICYDFNDNRYMSVVFKVADEVRKQHREEVTDVHASGWTLETLTVEESPRIVEVVGNWRKDPYDIEPSNCKICIGLRRNSVYYMTEMLMPALITSTLTLSAVVFQLSSVQVLLLAFSIAIQAIFLNVLDRRLPPYAASTPTILKYDGFNIVMTSILFLVSLFLRRLAQRIVVIPPPHRVDQMIAVINRLIPISINEKDGEDTDKNSFKYAPIAHTLNHLVFLLFIIIYIIVIFVCFVI